MNITKCVGTVGRMWADNVSTKFMDSLTQLAIYEQSKLKKGEYINYTKATVSWHELGRNQLVQSMVGKWLLMLDTDHVFAPDLLERLQRIAKKYNAPVVSAIYQYKFPPHTPVINMWEDKEGGSVGVKPILDWDRSIDVLRVGCCGAGAMLIQRPALEHIIRTFNEDPFKIVPGLSEDYSFCYRCKKLDIPVLVATQVEAHHLIPNVLSINDYIPDVTGQTTVTAPNGIIAP
jgi:hypothetical protein